MWSSWCVFPPQISLHPKLCIFLTYTSVSGWLLPPAINAEFRTFSMTPPDPEVVFGAHCTAMGFKSARILANKLMTLYNMIKEQLYVGLTCYCPPLSPSNLTIEIPHAHLMYTDDEHVCDEYHYGHIPTSLMFSVEQPFHVILHYFSGRWPMLLLASVQRRSATCFGWPVRSS